MEMGHNKSPELNQKNESNLIGDSFTIVKKNRLIFSLLVITAITSGITVVIPSKNSDINKTSKITKKSTDIATKYAEFLEEQTKHIKGTEKISADQYLIDILHKFISYEIVKKVIKKLNGKEHGKEYGYKDRLQMIDDKIMYEVDTEDAYFKIENGKNLFYIHIDLDSKEITINKK